MTDEERVRELSRYLKKRREFFGFTMTEMARIAGIPHGMYARSENAGNKLWTKGAQKIVDSKIMDDLAMRKIKEEKESRDKKMDLLAGKMKEARLKRRMTMIEVAEKLDINVSTYSNYENGVARKWSSTAEKIWESDFIQGDYEKVSRAIPDIPNFYERLDKLCNARGNIVVDVNHPDLQELRVAVGGDRVVTAESVLEYG